MILQLRADIVSIVEANDCGRLHVETMLTGFAVDAALRATGSGRLLDGRTALLDLEVLRARAGAAADVADWDERWRSLIEHARRAGWLSADGRDVQAHIEVSP